MPNGDDHEKRGTLETNVPDPKTPFDANMMGYEYYTYDGYVVPVGTDITITATPYSHQRFDSLVINDNDVTAQMQGNTYTYHVSGSAILKTRAYFSYDPNATDISAVVSSNVRVFSENDHIYINGASEKDIRIFNETGIQILSQKANQDSNCFVVEKGHIYLVQVDGITDKVAL